MPLNAGNGLRAKCYPSTANHSCKENQKAFKQALKDDLGLEIFSISFVRYTNEHNKFGMIRVGYGDSYLEIYIRAWETSCTMKIVFSPLRWVTKLQGRSSLYITVASQRWELVGVVLTLVFFPKVPSNRHTIISPIYSLQHRRPQERGRYFLQQQVYLYVVDIMYSLACLENMAVGKTPGMDSTDKRCNALSDGKPTTDWECIVKNGTFSGHIGLGTSFEDFLAHSGVQVFCSSLEVCKERHWRTPSANFWFRSGPSVLLDLLLRTCLCTAITYETEEMRQARPAVPNVSTTQSYNQVYLGAVLVSRMQIGKDIEETLCMQARNATVSKTLITPTPNTTHTDPQVLGGILCDRSRLKQNN
ncbi:hypothetical protein ARMSODRAFT_980573 [Armillaria solidipes]|uniref:Uncharacterized protein n=1 Tax=Armillaria solidipes TaxID=1076256 RepID=A0A2H3AUY2_9AGAR|nr:hypothetical protein ARMSODRAFT_980573 [Armillaria solidipes]